MHILPIKSGLDFLRRADGSIIKGNKAAAQRIADRGAAAETKQTGVHWRGVVWTGDDYYRINYGSMPFVKKK